MVARLRRSRGVGPTPAQHPAQDHCPKSAPVRRKKYGASSILRRSFRARGTKEGEGEEGSDFAYVSFRGARGGEGGRRDIQDFPAWGGAR
jgi:hypothetical protein